MEKIIKKDFLITDYYVPHIVYETDEFAVCFKPTNMPSAPLTPEEPHTLLSFFCNLRPEVRSVIGAKKSFEHGLLHRLDTMTTGLVLIAKKQSVYDSLLQAQNNNLFIKRYYAYCERKNKHDKVSTSEKRTHISSRFRAFGPDAKKVLPVFDITRQKKRISRTVYTTHIISIQKNNIQPKDEIFTVKAELSKGYRHQIRTHLQSINLPIIGDNLYNTNPSKYTLQLYATELEFPLFSTMHNKMCRFRYRIYPPTSLLLLKPRD